jgi:hypothetical protein
VSSVNHASFDERRDTSLATYMIFSTRYFLSKVKMKGNKLLLLYGKFVNIRFGLSRNSDISRTNIFHIELSISVNASVL